MKKRVFALLLCLIMCLSLLPVSAFADDCSHEIVQMPAKVTCGEAYREHYKCTRCGKLFSDPKGEYEISAESVAQAKPVHTSDLLHVDAELDITCIKGGNAEYWVCPDCGQMFSENPGVTEEGVDNRRTRPISDDKIKDYIYPALGHIVNPEIIPAVPHDCWNNGTIAHYSCDRCGAAFADPAGQEQLYDITDYTPGHSKIEYPEVRHTCDTDGNYYYFYCDVCGNYYDANGMQIEEGSWVDPARHDYVEHPASDPTCMSEGNVFYYSCENCGKVFDADKNETTLDAVTIPKVPHSLTIHVDAVPKTCYTDGNVEYWQCDVYDCGAKFADAEGTVPLENVIIPASHEFMATEAKAATCTEPGNIAYKTCTVEGCGVIVNEEGAQIWLNDTIIQPLGHKPVKVERTTTCTEAGVAEHYKCENCGKLFLDEACTVETTLEDLQEEALGHDYDWEGWCTRCKAVSPDSPAFNPPSVTVPNNDGTYVVVTVSAPEGVFPANCLLSVQPVYVVDEQSKEAVDAQRQEGTTVAKTFTYDIKVLKNGEEIQPADGSKVKVSFALATAANENLNATVYHVTEAEDGRKSAEALETNVENVNGAEGEKAVVAETDGFSEYTVEFTYSQLEYILPGGTNVALTEILDTLDLHGNIIENVVSSSPDLFDAINEGGVWTVYSYEPFHSDETLTVWLDGVDYVIHVTDSVTIHVKVNRGTAETDTESANTEITVTVNTTPVIVTIKATPVPDKTSFEKWTPVSGVTASDLSSDITSPATFTLTSTSSTNIELTANYRPKVKYESTDSVTPDSANWPNPAEFFVNPGAAVEKPEKTPTATGYRFLGWYNAAGTAITFPLTINDNTTIYAHWIKTWKVTYTTAHGTISDITPNPMIVDDGSKAQEPKALSWIGYKWGGWYANGKAFNFKTDTIAADTTIYANWIPDFKITKGNGGTAHYGSNYAFTLNYYYPDYLKHQSDFKVYVSRQGSSTVTELTKNQYVIPLTFDNNTDKRVVVTLKASYIRTLTDGATYDILFDTGLPDPPVDLGDTLGYFKVSKSPKTGDESNVGLWIAIAAVSFVAVIAIIAYLLHKRKKSKLPPTPPEKAPENEKKTKKPPKE